MHLRSKEGEKGATIFELHLRNPQRKNDNETQQ